MTAQISAPVPSGLRWVPWSTDDAAEYPLGWDLVIPGRAGCIGWINVEPSGYRAFLCKPWGEIRKGTTWGEIRKGTITDCARALVALAKQPPAQVVLL